MRKLPNNNKLTKKRRSRRKRQSKTGLAARLGVSRSTVHEWRQRGCPVSEGDEAVLSWAMANARRGFESNDIREARLGVLRQTERRLRLGNDVKSDVMLQKGEVQFAIAKAVNMFLTSLDRLADQELPAVLKGCNEIAIQSRLTEAFRRVKDELIDGLKNLASDEPVNGANRTEVAAA